MSKELAKKILGIASRVITCILVAVAVFMMAFTLISTIMFDKTDRDLFGIKMYIVLTDSMSLSENNKDDKVHFDAGDLVFVKKQKDNTKLQEGDIISFVSQNNDSFMQTITHKIKKVEKTEDGMVIGYITYGTNTGEQDDVIVEPSFVLGKYTGKIPNVGHFFAFLKTTPGYIVCILIPFLLLILWQGINVIRLFRQYRREQMADIEAERAEIKKEREESAKMMEELMKLREQLSNQANGENNSTSNTTTSADGDITAPTDENT